MSARKTASKLVENPFKDHGEFDADVHVEQVSHPPHYQFPGGAEVITIVEHLPFNRGAAIKYIARAGRKGSGDSEEVDLKKAAWFISRELARIKK